MRVIRDNENRGPLAATTEIQKSINSREIKKTVEISKKARRVPGITDVAQTTAMTQIVKILSDTELPCDGVKINWFPAD